MKDMEQIEEMLNCYIDGELDERKSNEVKRLIDNDSQIQSLYDSLKRYKNLMDTVCSVPSPEGLCDNITAHLEREVLLADTQIYSLKAGRRHLMARRLMTAAAVIALAAVLTFVIFDIFVPKSSRQQLLSGALRKKVIKQVLYEKPFDETKQQQDTKIVPQNSYDVPLVAVLTLKTNSPIEVDWSVAKALTTTNLFNQTAAIDRRTGVVRYVINCNDQSLVSLMQELSFIWPRCTDTKIDIGTEQAGKYITIDNIGAGQVIEICKAENSGQRLRMANDLAIINKFTTPAITDRLYAAADIDYDLLVTQKPTLTSTEKTQIAGQSSNEIKNATLTIIVISN